MKLLIVQNSPSYGGIKRDIFWVIQAKIIFEKFKSSNKCSGSLLCLYCGILVNSSRHVSHILKNEVQGLKY